MQLFGSYTSPYVRHCRMALLQAGIAHEFIEADAQTSAALSPTKKIPFLHAGDTKLSDSTTILRFIREQAKHAFLDDLADHDVFCLTSTLMDSAINLFYLEKEGVGVDAASYLQRQQLRIEDGLKYLETICPSNIEFDNDAHLRLAIFLSWGLFRQRFTLNGLSRLQAFLNVFDENDHFQNTKPSD